mmetsp:Transcript_4433/g.12411  ORF Transcript_4433/g.12411 Transcript_4433/m.12411 type:complete len:317 (+) Transcript_4433:2483-3433(+)
MVIPVVLVVRFDIVVEDLHVVHYRPKEAVAKFQRERGHLFVQEDRNAVKGRQDLGDFPLLLGVGGEDAGVANELHALDQVFWQGAGHHRDHLEVELLAVSVGLRDPLPGARPLQADGECAKHREDCVLGADLRFLVLLQLLLEALQPRHARQAFGHNALRAGVAGARRLVRPRLAVLDVSVPAAVVLHQEPLPGWHHGAVFLLQLPAAGVRSAGADDILVLNLLPDRQGHGLRSEALLLHGVGPEGDARRRLPIPQLLAVSDHPDLLAGPHPIARIAEIDSGPRDAARHGRLRTALSRPATTALTARRRQAQGKQA